MQLLCVCTAFNLVLRKLGIPITERLESSLGILRFLEHAPRPGPLDDTIQDIREELEQLFFEQNPDAIYRRWLIARVKNVGHNAQTPEERDFAIVQEFDTKFADGGFEELFYKPYGEKLPGVLEALERVGATDTRSLLQEGMDAIGDPYPTGLTARRKAWDSKAARGVKKNKWENSLDALYAEYMNLEERCADAAAKRAVEGYVKRGMPVPPPIPAKKR